MRRIVAILVLPAILAGAGCQTRHAQPVQVSQAGDAALDCEMIRELQIRNRAEAARLAKLDEGVALGNAIAMTISQAWFWPAVLGVDLSDAEQIEARALKDRNRRLEEIAQREGCPEAAKTS